MIGIMGVISLKENKRNMLSIENREKLAIQIQSDIEFVVHDLRSARMNNVITEDEYDNYSFFVKRYFQRLCNKIIKNDKEAK